MNPESPSRSDDVDRRQFLKTASVAASLAVPGALAATASAATTPAVASSVAAADSLFHGHEWETLNPGYWQFKDGALRRRLSNYGDRARATGFPFHYETHQRNGGVMDMDYDPSLPEGILYRRDWKLSGEFSIAATFTYRGVEEHRRDSDPADWKMFQEGYGLMGVALGAKSLFESYGKHRNTTVVSWTNDGKFQVVPKAKKGKRKLKQKVSAVDVPKLNVGDQVELAVSVKPISAGVSNVVATFKAPDGKLSTVAVQLPSRDAAGFVGIVGRGALDFEVNDFQVKATSDKQLRVNEFDCYGCYPLGDTLRLEGSTWKVRFVGLFVSDGSTAEIRVADTPTPHGGWEEVPIAGRAPIVNNEWRRNTASIEVALPINPAEKTTYYTVWKDGKDVTADTRIGSDATGPGTGLVGDVPRSGAYVGRLPRLAAPYKICGLSCHAISSGLQQRTEEGFKILGGGDEWQFRDQPTVEAYKYLEDYDFQIMCWEDDVWYMELVLYPPSTDDAYKVVTTSICGPTSRWQMMRHWNVINPGDHDYGMDDVKGPEQIVIRMKDGLGQDRDYMRRNFQIVQHLISGDEDVDPLENPKKWRAWKMPNRDFTFAILDSRLWRSSQDTKMWDDEGWGHINDLYDRADPTRSLLGEEQFAWLQELVRTDSSPLICLSGLNGLHTVWTGGKKYSNTDEPFAQRDRVAADYAGWVAAGADRVIELLGSRDGIVTVYGDVHNGCIMKNIDHGLIECSFGPIGRSGGRGVIPGFGAKMKDFDGRPLHVSALYHAKYTDQTLASHPAGDPFYWNFAEMEFDPTKSDPTIGLRIRNLIDPPEQTPRGGEPMETVASKTGRKSTSELAAMKMLANADIRVVSIDGRPIRGTRSDQAGNVGVIRLTDVSPGSKVIVTAFNGKDSQSTVATAQHPS